MRPFTNRNRKTRVVTLLASLAAISAAAVVFPNVARAQDPTTPVPASPRPGSPTISDSAVQVPNDRTTADSEVRRKRYRFGPQLGMYFPTDERTRNRFGGSWTNLGIGIGGVPDAPQEGRLAFDAYVIYNSRGRNQALIAPVGVSYRRSLSNSSSVMPYIGGNASLYITDIRSEIDGVRAGIRATPGASIMGGLAVGQGGYFEARYHFIPEVSSFQLSGLNLTAGLRF